MSYITLVTLQEPCTACNIIQNLIVEMLEKLNKNEFAGKLRYEVIILSDLKNIRSIEGIEAEIFPALIVNGEQVTAGNLPSPQELLTYLQDGGNNES